ncbi:EthD family reductase [Paraglaciecola hydrolytica]|uniref:Ethyl tert-butyl ether degradation protein EthD n=1 Tax=Paraglaciecola hydrolytica TaxID=1799789 RepID=A0A135ZZA4_9ALTE|nr:EthD family reductase [Paraglaciecola hydrolytica]KXI28305.1 ethyl tert-butyl ether degradation protein EthD [Paraglaciecola hydrolytica]
MSDVKLMVLYPQPKDLVQFEKDYQEHIALFHQQTGIPSDARPYSVTKFFPTPLGASPFYQMFSMPFPSLEALQQTMSSPAMQIIAADAVRISSGVAPAVLMGSES